MEGERCTGGESGGVEGERCAGVRSGGGVWRVRGVQVESGGVKWCGCEDV